jgi:hypothetical protein
MKARTSPLDMTPRRKSTRSSTIECFEVMTSLFKLPEVSGRILAASSPTPASTGKAFVWTGQPIRLERTTACRQIAGGGTLADSRLDDSDRESVLKTEFKRGRPSPVAPLSYSLSLMRELSTQRHKLTTRRVFELENPTFAGDVSGCVRNTKFLSCSVLLKLSRTQLRRFPTTSQFLKQERRSIMSKLS